MLYNSFTESEDVNNSTCLMQYFFSSYLNNITRQLVVINQGLTNRVHNVQIYTKSFWKPCKVLYAILIQFCFLSFIATQISLFVENYHFGFLFISIFLPYAYTVFYRSTNVSVILINIYQHFLCFLFR